jgi:hypothetical protein
VVQLLGRTSVLIEARKQHCDLFVTETHPKVLYRALFGQKYDYGDNATQMNEALKAKLNVEVRISNDHEWDAAISALAALRGLQGAWKHDLHREHSDEEARLVEPCGETYYFWPE